MPPYGGTWRSILGGSNTGLAGISELFSRTWDIFRQRWLTLLGIVLAGVILMAAAIGIPIAAGAMLEIPMISGIAGLVFGFITVFWYTAAFVFAITNEKLDILAAFKKGSHRLLAFAWLTFVLGFVITGGFMLLIIPGIIFGVWFYFSIFVLATENERGMNAMLKSKAYVQGYGWAVFLRFVLLFFLIPLMLNLAVSFLGGLIGDLTGDPVITMILVAILSIPSLLFTFFAMLASYLIYEDLRAINKGIAFEPTAGQKTKWLAVAAAGVLLPFALVVTMSQLMGNGAIDLKEFSFNIDMGGIHIETEKKTHASPVEKTATPKAPKVSPLASGSMILIKGDCFQMGDFTKNGDTDERPVHRVCLKDFWMDTKEVTQESYEKATGNDPSRIRGANKPVTNVTWQQAMGFCRKLGKRLPTEAEWEYAAREGGKKMQWAGTRDTKNLTDYAWHGEGYDEGPHAAGLKKPNALGLYDMSGNVWEMVADRYHSHYYANSPEKAPQGPQTGNIRVMRGGAWFTRPVSQLRTTVRYITRENNTDNSIGFRCAK